MTTGTATKHRIRWYVWAEGVKMQHTANMRGMWGWDAACSCGWESRTGGATRRSVERLVWSHKWNAAHGFDLL